MHHTQFTTTRTGISRNHPAWRLWEKGKRLGVWNPSDIDFQQDISDWQRLQPDEQDILLRPTALFQAGEEAVTLDLLPLIQVIAAEGRLEKEIYLTSFLTAMFIDYATAQFQKRIERLEATRDNFSPA